MRWPNCGAIGLSACSVPLRPRRSRKAASGSDGESAAIEQRITASSPEGKRSSASIVTSMPFGPSVASARTTSGSSAVIVRTQWMG